MPLLGFWLYGLFDLDEGYYAAVVAEMNRRGDWITPFYNGHPWFEKPILLYWLAKPSVLLFGEAVGPRLPSILATVALFLVCGLSLRKRVSSLAGKWSVAILGTSLLIIALGRMMTTDAILDVCICAAFLSFWESLAGARAWRLVTALCLGLATLAKGPVALPLFVVLAVWTYVAEKDLRQAFRGYWLLGTLVLFATVALWYWPAYAVNGQIFVQKFFVEQNLQRFTGGDEAHRAPLITWPIYYPLFLLLGMIPWSIQMVKPWIDDLRGKGSPFERYLARWALIILLFFSLSSAKLPHYILPAVPPFAMLLACDLARRKRINWAMVTSLSVALCLLANAVFMFWYHKGGFAEVHNEAKVVNQMVDDGKGEVIAYQLARVKNGTGLQLNQVASPSLGFYLDESKISLDEESSLSGLSIALTVAPKNVSVFILTRPDRLSNEEIGFIEEHNGISLRPLPEEAKPPQYELYEIVQAAKAPGL